MILSNIAGHGIFDIGIFLRISFTSLKKTILKPATLYRCIFNNILVGWSTPKQSPDLLFLAKLFFICKLALPSCIRLLFFLSQPLAFCQDLKKALELSRQEFDCSFLDEDREEPDHSSSTGTASQTIPPAQVQLAGPFLQHRYS